MVQLPITRPKPKSSSDILHDSIREASLWGEIRRKAVTDQVLKDMIEQLKFYYIMKYDNGQYSKSKQASE